MKPIRDAPLRVAGGLALLLGGLLGASPAAADDAAAVARSFAGRLAAALEDSPVAQDALWAPGVRDSTRRLLDLRTAALFDWSGVRVAVESAVSTSESGGRAVDVIVVVSGTAKWKPAAYGVAQAFWMLQADEARESNRVVRREAWRLVPDGADWAAEERVRLSEVEVVSVDLAAGVYPAQDALLVDCSYYLRSLAEGVETMRFLLDRRAVIYHLLVNGQSVEAVRGGELGAMGLEGFSSESESSFRFPKPLTKGEEVAVRFRVRSPLVHMRGAGFVTTLPIHDGPFRERVWYPVPFTDHLPGSLRSSFVQDGRLEIRFPRGDLMPIDLATGAQAAGADEAGDAELMEEEVLRYRAAQHYRDFDFFLIEPGVDLESADWSAYDFSPFRLGGGLPFLPSLGGPSSDEDDWDDGSAARARLDPHPRSRRAVVEPLILASTYSARDLTAELEELVPLDLDEFDELFDEDSGDSDRGAGEPDRD